MEFVAKVKSVVKTVKRKVKSAVIKMSGRGRSEGRGGGSPRSGPTRGQSGGNLGGSFRGGRGQSGSVEDATQALEKMGGFGKNADGSRDIHVLANHFPIKLSGADEQGDFSLFQYHLKFTPSDIPQPKRKMTLKVWRKDVDCGGFLYDGEEMMYCTKQVAETEVVFEPKFNNPNTSPVHVKMTFTRKVGKDDPVCGQVYNLVLHQCMKMLQLQDIGTGFFDSNKAIKFDDLKLELWPGYQVSVVSCEHGPVLCVDLIHKVIQFEDVLCLIKKLTLTHSTKKLSIPLDQYILDALKPYVMMTPYNKRTYKIHGIRLNENPLSTFQKKDGTQISYVNYYRERHNIAISHLDQPILESVLKTKDLKGNRTEQTVCLIPELMILTGLSDEIRANFTIMKRLGQHLHMDPVRRVEGIKMLMTNITETPECLETLKKWGISFSTSLFKCAPGKVFPREAIIFAGDKSFVADEKNDFTKSLRDNQMLVSVPVEKWLVVTSKRDEKATREFIQAMVKVGGPLGMKIQKPIAVEALADVRTSAYVRFLDNIKSTVYPDLQLVLCVLPNNGSELYSAIKKRLTKDLGVASQCVVSKTMTKGLSVATKVAIQINAKLGGEPWKVAMPAEFQNNSMAIGLDVVGNGNRTGVMVATINTEYTKYFSVTFQASSDEDFHAQVLHNLQSCLELYKKTCDGKIPTCVVMYRHNAQEGLINSGCIELYARGLLEGANEWWSSNQVSQDKTTFLYITVAKSANTRIFAHRGKCEEGKEVDNLSMMNPPPGTVVDKDIVASNKYKEFFMVPTAARQGTVRAIHYRVILDTGSIPSHVVQAYTNKLCHLYYNWSGAVNLPCVIQYAAKYAKQKTQAMANHQPHPRLGAVLHYL